MNEDLYFPAPGLKAAVEVARDLHMPLLVTGEPGTGKTELAKWIAGPEMLNSEAAPYRFDTKTTSQAKDLFYRYDAIRHFANKNASPLGYITFEAMGKAILRAEEKTRQVVLVDEIDKAPRDFPNDVLFQFEQFAFRIEEATRDDIEKFDFTNVAGRKEIDLDENDNIRLPRQENDPKSYIAPPFLLLTSNSEKNLPDAFLRRCVFYHIPFPDEADLKKIVIAKAKVLDKDYHKHLKAIIALFELIRDRGPNKKPATAELIRWVESLYGRKVDWEVIYQELEKQESERSMKHFEALWSTMPVLLKNKEDFDKFGKLLPVLPESKSKKTDGES